MRTLRVQTQLLVIDDEKFLAYSSVLDMLGVKYAEFEGNPELAQEAQNLKLIDLRIEGNWGAVFHQLPNFHNITLEEFCESYTKEDLLRMRNVGPKTVASLSRELAKYGFAW